MINRQRIIAGASVLLALVIAFGALRSSSPTSHRPVARGALGGVPGGGFLPPTKIGGGGGGGGSGDITGVTAGSGVTGGGASGAVTIDVGAGSGIAVAADSVAIDPTYTQRRVVGTCSGNNGMLTIAQDGTVTCATGTGDITDVIAGVGLVGGGASGAVTVDVTCGSNITCATNGIDLAPSIGVSGTISAAGAIAEAGNRVYSITGDGLSSSAATVQMRQDCSTDQVLRWTGSDWTCQGAGVAAVVQTSALSGTQNDFALNSDTTLLVFTSGSTLTLNGLQGGVDGRCIDIVKPSGLLSYVNAAGGSTTTMQIATSGAATWTATAAALTRVCYQATSSRWNISRESRMATLTVDGAAALNGGTTATGTIALGTATTGTTTTKGPAVLDQTLGVTGIATLSGGTTATGTVNLGTASSGTTTVKGPAVFDQTVNITGNLTRGTASTTFRLIDLDSTQRPVATACGTTPTVVGNDASGVVTVGTGGASSCTVTLNTALSSRGGCVGTLRGAASTYTVTGAGTVTGFIVTAALGAGAKIDYRCADH